MIIGFLGKGGSGKSTLSNRFVSFLIEEHNLVLAIDADHNMDLTFNLGIEEELKYLGTSKEDLLSYAGLPTTARYSEIIEKDLNPVFTLLPADVFTEKYAKKVGDNLMIMSAGPHTNDVLYDKSCSHVLSTSLKIYLPFLQLKEHEYVVMDEKAGSDGAGTGISSGLSFALICSEPTVHGSKAANQIADLLEFYGTPYEFVLNKIQEEIDPEVLQRFKKKPLFSFNFNKEMLNPKSLLSTEEKEEFSKIDIYIKNYLHIHGDNRKERSILKFKNNKEHSD